MSTEFANAHFEGYSGTGAVFVKEQGPRLSEKIVGGPMTASAFIGKGSFEDLANFILGEIGFVEKVFHCMKVKEIMNAAGPFR